jgi:predicted transcriptional regulator
MFKRSPQAHLQNRILLSIEHNRVNSITGLALKLDAHRSSVSRAMHALEAIGLLSKANGQWGLSKSGQGKQKEFEANYQKEQRRQ